MAKAGLGADLLIANEVLDHHRLGSLTELGDGVDVTVAVDSESTIEAAARAGVRRCLIDVDVGLPRCGCDPADAGRLADFARSKGLDVRGVMGYEGHLMVMDDRARQQLEVDGAMERLRAAHADVGGDVVSAGGTGTYDLHGATGVTEVQAGSYALMDSYYATLGLPFEQALFVVGTVISVRPTHAVADVGLKALGMDHGNPAIADATVWFCSDEHVTFAASRRPRCEGRRPGARRAGARRPDDGDARGGLAGARRRGAGAVGDRSAGLVMRKQVAWLAAAGLAGIATSPWITPANGRLVTVARALMPWAGLTGIPLGRPRRPPRPARRRRLRRGDRRGDGSRVRAAAAPSIRTAGGRRRHGTVDHARQPAVDEPPRSRRRSRAGTARRGRHHVQRVHAAPRQGAPRLGAGAATTRTRSRSQRIAAVV